MNAKKIQPNIPCHDKYGKYDELCSKFHYTLSLNLPSDSNEKYTAKLYICKNSHRLSIRFNDFSLANKMKSNSFVAKQENWLSKFLSPYR